MLRLRNVGVAAQARPARHWSGRAAHKKGASEEAPWQAVRQMS